jgi:hypothetical protein
MDEGYGAADLHPGRADRCVARADTDLAVAHALTQYDCNMIVIHQ